MTETKSLKEITSTLENHASDLEKLNVAYNRIKNKYEEDVRKRCLTPRRKEIYIYTLDEALGLVGDWSKPVFNILADLEDLYLKRHQSSPKLGRKLFLQKYEELHKPYDQMKNRLWKLLLTIKGEEENE